MVGWRLVWFRDARAGGAVLGASWLHVKWARRTLREEGSWCDVVAGVSVLLLLF